MSNPLIIYKQFHKYKPVEDFSGHQWFALTKNYGTEYGDISRRYQFRKEPKLLNIGDADLRVMIENEVNKRDPNLLVYCNPDEQYSGTKSNKKYHDILQNIFGEDYDGTIIDQNQLNGNKKYPISELEGPSEIVIWKDYDGLLEELPDDMGKGKGINKLTKTKTRKIKTKTKTRKIKTKTKTRKIKTKTRKIKK
jgi:hypothetical protein